MAAILLGVSAYHAWQADRMALAGKKALLRAERDFSTKNLDSIDHDLLLARSKFRDARSQLGSLDPAGLILREIPLVRTQIRGAEEFAAAGELLAGAGTEVTQAGSRLTHPADAGQKLSDAISEMRSLQGPIDSGLAGIDRAIGRLHSLDGLRLLWPLGSARDNLAKHLPAIRNRALSAQQGVAATIEFLGGAGPKRYLLFSQNPDEVRPTGGYLGTYGVLSANSGRLTLERYENIANWTGSRPDAAIPQENAPSPFPYIPAPFPQTLANANTVPDWPQSARAALDMWQKGGEAPVDGAIAVTPAFLARLLGVIGPVTVASYGETVSAANLISRFEYHTKLVEAKAESNITRKEFVVELAGQVFQQLGEVPSSRWEALAKAMGEAFDAREIVAWFSDTGIQPAMEQRGWDGALPPSSGDFMDDAEFEFAAKNGRGLKRSYGHTVDIRPDGSAQVTTVLTILNTDSAGALNVDSLSYVRIYGPAGATLDPDSDTPAAIEPPIAGHPAAGWFLTAVPGGQGSLKVVWDVPSLVQRAKDGTWTYSLNWVRVNDHSGDVVNLAFKLPKGWRWKGRGPDPTIKLDRDVKRRWSLSTS